MSDRYTVKPGDTLGKIAKDHHTTVEDLAKENDIDNTNKIKVDQKLVLPEVVFRFEDSMGDPIGELICKLTYCGKEETVSTDAQGETPPIVTKKPKQDIKVAVKTLDGLIKEIGKIKSGSTPKVVTVKSPKKLVQVTTERHRGAAGSAETRSRHTGPTNGAPTTTVLHNRQGNPVAVIAAGPTHTEKSGVQWCSRFMQSNRVEDLEEPFQGKVKKFLEALRDAGIAVRINTTLRPPQRSYLMYYAREVATGRISPTRVPPFSPRNGDSPVNIDWAHHVNGRPDLAAARQAAIAMNQRYAAAGAIGRPYVSNHNRREAIDMRLTPAWGIGRRVRDIHGHYIAIRIKRDIIMVGASYGVFHWNYTGQKPKVDDPHWSKDGR